ncbi:MAG: hypothetical protein ACR2LI_17015 [Propionibacteriaceae bacterium]
MSSKKKAHVVAVVPASYDTLLFDLPFSAQPPRMINPELGLPNLVSRRGHNAGYAIDITLLDAPDHRLIRSGVLLGHRVIDGRGEWYLGAPDWEPMLPAERIEPMGHAEIPEEFADLVRPFRRRATLGPVAALSLVRAEFCFRGAAGTTVALLRDDKVTVRRGGLTTARFREVMLTPVGPGLTTEQIEFLGAALGGVGATPVARFPRLVTRLGAPATGLTDFPVPPAVHGISTFESFVSALLATRLRELVKADLAVRTEGAGAPRELRDVAAGLRTDLQGLAAVLEPLWSQDLQEELDWLVEQADAELAGGPKLVSRLRGERYLTLLERLVTASRAPQVGESALLPSGDVVEALVHEATERLVETVERARVDGPQETWDEVTEAMTEVDRAAAVAVRLDSRRVAKLRRRLDPAQELLAEVSSRAGRLGEIQREGELQSGPEAFAAGRCYEREVHQLDVAREAFLEAWPKVSVRLRDVTPVRRKKR